MDFVVDVPYMPKVGETIIGNGFKTIPGGKGANQAFACAKLGGETYMLGVVGNDEFGGELIASIGGAGVRTDCIKKSAEARTGLAVIYVNSEGNNNIVVVPGANNLCTVEYIKQHTALIEECGIIVMQCEIPFETIEYVMDIAKSMNKTIILNPAPAPKHLPKHLLEKIVIITPNESELQSITGCEIETLEQMVRGSEKLLADGVKTVVFTWGENGSVCVTRDGYEHFPAHRVSAVDTTAAGDSFTAAIAVALSEGKDMADAIRFASKVASIVVTRKGAQPSIPSRKEVL